MTATVNIITAEAKNVLRVRPSALAFEPALAQAVAAKSAKKTAAKIKRTAAKPGADVWVLKDDGSLAPVPVQRGSRIGSIRKSSRATSKKGTSSSMD